MYMNCLEREREWIRILKLFLSMLTSKIGVCNRVAKFDRTHRSCTKIHLPTQIKTNTAIFLVETAASYYIKKHLVFASIQQQVEKTGTASLIRATFRTLIRPTSVMKGMTSWFYEKLGNGSSTKMMTSRFYKKKGTG